MNTSNLYHIIVIVLFSVTASFAQASMMPQAICAGLLKVAQSNPGVVITEQEGHLGKKIAEHLEGLNTRGSAEVFAQLLWPEEGQRSWVVLFEVQSSNDAHQALATIMESVNESEFEIHRDLAAHPVWARWLFAVEAFLSQDRAFQDSLEAVYLASREARKTEEPILPFTLTGKTIIYQDRLSAHASSSEGERHPDFELRGQALAVARESVLRGLRSVSWAFGLNPDPGPESARLSVTLIMNPPKGRGVLVAMQIPRRP